MCTIFATLNWTIILSSLIVIIGWIVSYYFLNIQILKTKQKEVLTSYLIEAYKNIENACGRKDERTIEQTNNLENALGIIQLFGTLKQIELAKKMASEMNCNSVTDPRELLVLLRNDLRKELDLEQAPINYNDIIHWRIKK